MFLFCLFWRFGGFVFVLFYCCFVFECRILDNLELEKTVECRKAEFNKTFQQARGTSAAKEGGAQFKWFQREWGLLGTGIEAIFCDPLARNLAASGLYLKSFPDAN